MNEKASVCTCDALAGSGASGLYDAMYVYIKLNGCSKRTRSRECAEVEHEEREDGKKLEWQLRS